MRKLKQFIVSADFMVDERINIDSFKARLEETLNDSFIVHNGYPIEVEVINGSFEAEVDE